MTDEPNPTTRRRPETPTERRGRFDAAVAVIGIEPGAKLHWEQRAVTLCQAREDECTYEHCPRWRGGHLIDERHYALDFVGDDDDGQ